MANDAAAAGGSICSPDWGSSSISIELSNRETIAALGRVPVETLERLDLDRPGSWPGLPAGLERALA